MSTNYYAYTVVGIKFAKNEIYRSEKARLCKHPLPEDKNAKFCPVCGQKLWQTIEESIPEYDDMTEQLAGVPAVWDTDQRHLFVGVVTKTEDSGKNDIELPLIKDMVKRPLELKGLWHEKRFAIWTVLYCSY